MIKKDIKNFTSGELEKALIKINEPPYRARQVFSWLYREGGHDFDLMSSIPKALKERLETHYYISAPRVSEHLKSTDGTEKVLFKLEDGHFIETVIICTKKRKTLCLSTQVGCNFSCPFCASGRKGFIRNLTVSEIINQVLYFRQALKHRITNYVFMGMGEPLDNYENVATAIKIMSEPLGMDIGARRITISTCGVITGIDRLKNLGLQVNLSVSLHAANNKLRDKLMPVNKAYPIERLIKACEDFMNKTGRMITLEYILVKDMNDSIEDADELGVVARRLRAKVNLIPYSPVPGMDFQPPGQHDIKVFMNRLVRKRVKVTLRESKGKGIQAACGQLAGR